MAQFEQAPSGRAETDPGEPGERDQRGLFLGTGDIPPRVIKAVAIGEDPGVPPTPLPEMPERGLRLLGHKKFPVLSNHALDRARQVAGTTGEVEVAAPDHPDANALLLPAAHGFLEARQVS